MAIYLTQSTYPNLPYHHGMIYKDLPPFAEIACTGDVWGAADVSREIRQGAIWELFYSYDEPEAYSAIVTIYQMIFNTAVYDVIAEMNKAMPCVTLWPEHQNELNVVKLLEIAQSAPDEFYRIIDGKFKKKVQYYAAIQTVEFRSPAARLRVLSTSFANLINMDCDFDLPDFQEFLYLYNNDTCMKSTAELGLFADFYMTRKVKNRAAVYNLLRKKERSLAA